ncbi:Uncharacterised protein [Vibrio cholerae]|nr:Uncharacterised protein [Vibrio cholerae]
MSAVKRSFKTGLRVQYTQYAVSVFGNLDAFIGEVTTIRLST